MSGLVFLKAAEKKFLIVSPHLPEEVYALIMGLEIKFPMFNLNCMKKFGVLDTRTEEKAVECLFFKFHLHVAFQKQTETLAISVTS